jgi:ADP-ribose pyrophosphatase YjhB (NUDIX family)
MKKKKYLSTGIFLINKKFKKNEYYHYLQTPHVVVTVPVLKNKKFIVVFQKREPINKKNYEFPSGLVDKNEGFQRNAKRELYEETGYKCLSALKKLLVLYPDPGRLNHSVICYLAKNLIKINKPEKGIKIFYFTKKEIIGLIKKRKFNSATHIAAFYHYLSKKN